MADRLSQEEFATWEPFAAAFNRLSVALSESKARDEIRERLAHGDLRAAARRALSGTPRNQEVTEFLVLGSALWTEAEVMNNYSNAWTTSTYTFRIRRLHNTPSELNCTGLRLEPGGLEQILIDAGVPTPSQPLQPDSPEPETVTRRQDLPMLPEPIARAWVDWFKAQPGSSKEAAEKAALHMFPNHNFSRDRIRDLMGLSDMGRPLKTTA